MTILRKSCPAMVLWTTLLLYLLLLIAGQLIVMHWQGSETTNCVCDNERGHVETIPLNEDGLPFNQKKLVNSGNNSTNGLSVNRNTTSSHPFVFYNRVPKCGSSSTRQLIQEMSKLHHFTFIQARTYMKFWLTGTEQVELRERLKAYNKPLVFERHLHFLDFVSSGMETPVYINIIRDPIDRLASWYYFRRFQPGHVRNLSLEDRIRSYDECVLGDHPECTSPLGNEPEQGHFKIIPFFCGQDPECRQPTERALLRAIDNVKRHYLVVGLTERYEEFLQVLEHLLPEYFSGASEIYNQTRGATKHETIYKLPVSPEARSTMNRSLFLEYQFYHFITRRFQKQVKKLLNTS